MEAEAGQEEVAAGLAAMEQHSDLAAVAVEHLQLPQLAQVVLVALRLVVVEAEHL
jgi:hypothetical protein